MRAACLLLTPRYALVDRDQYAARVDRELVMGMGMSDFASRPEPERKAMLGFDPGALVRSSPAFIRLVR